MELQKGRIQGTNSQVAAIIAKYQSSQTPSGHSSRLGRAPNVERHRQVRGQFLLEDYFIKHQVYGEAEFRRKYRMHKHVSMRIIEDLCNHNDFRRQKPDVAGKLGLLPKQKMATALRVLAHGAVANQCDEMTRMRASSTYAEVSEEIM